MVNLSVYHLKDDSAKCFGRPNEGYHNNSAVILPCIDIVECIGNCYWDKSAFLTRSFCLHLTAIRAKVTQITELESRKIHTLAILNTFKEGAQFYKVTPTKAIIQGPVRSGTAWTRTDGCGMDLQLGNVYLLTGKIEKSEDADLHITRCGWNVEFQNVGKNKQKTLENYYKKEQEKCWMSKSEICFALELLINILSRKKAIEIKNNY